MTKTSSNCIKVALEYLNNGDMESAKNLYLKLADASENCVTSRRALARIHTQEHQWDQAVVRWEEVREKRPDIREVSLRLARLFEQLGRFSQALAEYQKYIELEPGHRESIKSIARLQMKIKHAAVKDVKFNVRHVAIACVSYSGSTILSRVLGKIDGIENIGESHRLVTLLGSRTNAEVDFENLHDETTSFCYSCGKQCQQFTLDFRRQLQLDPANWYFKIGQHLRANVVVSSDKNYAKLISKDPFLRMDAIVLFKHPLQAWYSNYRKTDLAEWGTGRFTQVDEYMEKWLQSYQRLINEFDVTGSKIFLDFEQFCEKPELHLHKLCQLLGLEWKPDIIGKPGLPQHSFGGNQDVNDNLKKQSDQLKIRKLSRVKLPEDHKQQIDKKRDVGEMFQQLEALYKRDFATLQAPSEVHPSYLLQSRG